MKPFSQSNSLSVKIYENIKIVSQKDYVILGPLGRGAGSFVYKIQCRKTKTEFALKVIDKKKENFNAIAPRIKNEIMIHSKLENENIVKLVNSFEDSDNLYLLLEYCHRGEFYTYLKSKQNFDENEIRNYGLQLAKALKYLHDQKIIHRDIKLGNLLLDQQNNLKICDFGLSVQVTDQRPERETLCGTPNYISPEIANKESYGEKNDCWAYGCILYAFITGHPPFEGNSIQETLNNIKHKNFEFPSNISDELLDLLKKTINWSVQSRLSATQILNHSFFIGNKFSFCVPNMSNGINISEFTLQNQNCMTNKSEKDSPKTPNKKRLQILPQFSKTNSSKIYVDETFMSTRNDKEKPKLFKQDSNLLVNTKMNVKPASNSMNSEMFRTKLGKEKFENINLNGNKENIAYYDNSSKTSKNKESVKSLGGQNFFVSKNYINKSNSKTDLKSGLNTTPSSFNTISTTEFNSNFLVLANNNSVNINFNTSKILNTSSISQNEKLVPLSTKHLKPIKISTKHCSIQIKSDKFIEISNDKIFMSIAPDGNQINLSRSPDFTNLKNFTLNELPQKYLHFYNYAKQVCDKLKARVPKTKISNSVGKFYIYLDEKEINYEAFLKNGFRTFYKLNSETIKIENNSNDFSMEVSTKENLNKLDPKVAKMIRVSFMYLRECLRIGEIEDQEENKLN